MVASRCGASCQSRRERPGGPGGFWPSVGMQCLPLSVFWHTSDIALNAVTDVVDLLFFSYVIFDVVNFAFFFARKF